MTENTNSSIKNIVLSIFLLLLIALLLVFVAFSISTEFNKEIASKRGIEGQSNIILKKEEKKDELLELLIQIRSGVYFDVSSEILSKSYEKEAFDYIYSYFNYFNNLELIKRGKIKTKTVPLPDSKIFTDHELIINSGNPSFEQKENRKQFQYLIPYLTLKAWYKLRFSEFESTMYFDNDSTINSYAGKFIAYFGNKGIPEDVLSQIMALNLELDYRFGRNTKMFGLQNIWNSEVQKSVFTKIETYKQNYPVLFSKTYGAINWINSLENLVNKEITSKNKKEAIDSEERLLGLIPGMR